MTKNTAPSEAVFFIAIHQTELNETNSFDRLVFENITISGEPRVA